jgi:hypothetical protein
MIVAIFTNIFISRSKDVVDSIRHRCLVHLGEWIITDPERSTKTIYSFLFTRHSHLLRVDGLTMTISSISVGWLLIVLIRFDLIR